MTEDNQTPNRIQTITDEAVGGAVDVESQNEIPADAIGDGAAEYQSGVGREDYDSELIDSQVAQALDHRANSNIQQSGFVAKSNHTDGSEQSVRFKVPGTHHDFYEHNPTLDEISSSDLDDKDALTLTQAERFAMRQGLHVTIAENARLHQDLKNAQKARQRSLLVTICLSLLLATLLFGFTQYPKTKYIATMDNNAICGVDAQNNPNITDPQIADFAKDAVLQIYTLDYVNYADQVEAALSRYFTPTGRQAQVNAFALAGTLDDVSKNAVTLRAGAANAPRIEEKGITNDGKPFWVVRFPMVIDSYSGSSTPVKTSKFIASITVKADTASAQNPTGLGVETVNLIPQ